MENNFIQMAASAGHAVAYTIGPIFSTLLIVCSCISPMALRILSFEPLIFSGLLFSVILIFDGTPQI